MDKADIISTLRIIAAKSESIGGEAAKTIQAVNTNSPVVNQRLNLVAAHALGDPAAGFTPDERAQIAALLVADETGTRDFILRVRLTQDERLALEQAAQDEGQSMSEYVRSKIL